MISRTIFLFSTFKKTTSAVFSSDIATALLKNPNNYTEANILNLLTSFEVLKRDSLNNTALPITAKLLETFSSNFPMLIKKVPADQLPTLLTCANSLKIASKRFWDTLENHILASAPELDSQNLSQLIGAFSFSGRQNILVWDAFEDRCLKLLDREEEFSDETISTAFKGFTMSKMGSKILIRRFKEKIISLLDRMHPQCYTSIANSLMLSGNTDPGIVAAFIKSFDRIKEIVTGNSVSTLLIFFLKNEAHREVIDTLEDLFVDNIHYMTLLSLGNTAETYAMLYGAALKGYPKKLELLKLIETTYRNNRARLNKYDNKKLNVDCSINIIWGLFKLGLITDSSFVKGFVRDPEVRKIATAGKQKRKFQDLATNYY